MRSLFWISVFGVFYPYFGYPIALWTLGKVFRRSSDKAFDSPLPSVSMIIPVFNELDSDRIHPRPCTGAARAGAAYVGL